MNLTVSTKYVCGINLHARKISICVMNIDGTVLLKKNIDCAINVFLDYIKPFKRSITVGVEATYDWHWLLDQWKENNSNCALGHALCISRMKSSKHKDDPVDARDIAEFL